MRKEKKLSASKRSCTLCTLPDDILKKIIRPLSFKEKCSLELMSRQLYALLSKPVPSEGLWGSCDLTSDLRLNERYVYDSRLHKESIMRWLPKRLPGFTHLLCNTESRYRHRFDEHPHDGRIENVNQRDSSGSCKKRVAMAAMAAAWLVTELSELSASRNGHLDKKLHLTITSDMTLDLLGLNADGRIPCCVPTPTGEQESCFQSRFWAGLSESLTELSITIGVEYGHGTRYMHPDSDTQIRTDVLTQLKNLTGLKIQGYRCCYTWDLQLDCPKLRSLTLEHCWILGRLSLQAPLEDLSLAGLLNLHDHVHQAFPLSNLLGLTYCQCQFLGAEHQEWFYAILPQMSMLKAFDFVLYQGALPPCLPASLQDIRYLIATYWDPRNLERIAYTCQLPALQSVSLLRCAKWEPSALSSLKKVKQESKAKVVLEDERAYEPFDLLK